MLGITCLSMANRGVWTRTGSESISEIMDLVYDIKIFHLHCFGRFHLNFDQASRTHEDFSLSSFPSKAFCLCTLNLQLSYPYIYSSASVL
jgi:hypothetical protein